MELKSIMANSTQNPFVTLPNGDKKEVITNILNLKNCNLNKIENIEGLSALSHLKELNLQCNNICKISGLDHLKELKNLRLNNNKIQKIEGISKLSNLHLLNLENNQIEKIEGLHENKELRFLQLGSNQIKKIENLRNQKMLNFLNLDNNQIGTLDCLHELIFKKKDEEDKEEKEEINLIRFSIENNLLKADVIYFIYSQDNCESLINYCKQKSLGILRNKKFFDPNKTDPENIELLSRVLESKKKYLVEINTHSEDYDLKSIQEEYFTLSPIITPIILKSDVPLNKLETYYIHLIQIHSIKGIGGPENKKEFFNFFLKLFWDEETIEDNALNYENDPIKNKRVHAKIDELIHISLQSNKHSKIIIFPENAIPYKKIDDLINISKKEGLIIIGGLEHKKMEDVFINQAFIIDNGKIDYQIKQTPAFSKGKDGSKDLIENIECQPIVKIKIFKTSIGNVAIFVCKDFLRLSGCIPDWAEKNKVEWIFVPSLTSKVLPFHLRLNEMYHSSEFAHQYLKVVFCNVGEYGGSEYYSGENMNEIESKFKVGSRDNIGETIVIREIGLD